jgi:hypothetical protein
MRTATIFDLLLNSSESDVRFAGVSHESLQPIKQLSMSRMIRLLNKALFGDCSVARPEESRP